MFDTSFLRWSAHFHTVDTSLRSGPYPTPLPYTFGGESSGVIVHLPSSETVLKDEAYKRRGFSIGDRVAVVSFLYLAHERTVASIFGS